MNTLERLVYMANQIARNFAAMGDVDASLATADHIDHYWDPRMKALIFDRLDTPESGLSPIAAAAIAELRDQGPPPPQTRATEDGGSDAG